MVYFVGLDVSVKATSVCVVDDAGKVILEQKVPTEPADIIAILSSLGVSFGRIGIEAGPLSQWLVNALVAADLPVICVETRHMKALLTAQQISKTDRNDARGIAQMMRVGLFKPVHVKTLVAQEQRMLLTSRKLLQRKLLDVESDLRGTLRNFGLKASAEKCPHGDDGWGEFVVPADPAADYGGRAAGDLRRDAAHEGFTDGAANQ